MKVAVFGGAGLRVPMLANALSRSALDVSSLSLFDADSDRLAAMLPIVQASAPGLAVSPESDAAVAARDARLVFFAIRVGGQKARAHDERACLSAGVLGQETIGAAGAALLMRNASEAMELARVVEREAPDALVVNYANPAGLVTEALLRETGVRVVGVCDTPDETAARAASVLGLDPDACAVGWSGVNHCGWLTSLGERDADGPPPENLLDRLARSPNTLSRVHRFPLFEPEEMARAIPSEYVFFHMHPDRALARSRAAGVTRGEQVLKLEAGLFGKLAEASDSSVDRATSGLRAYRDAMAERDETYFGIESGMPRKRTPNRDCSDEGPAPSGYDRIGLRVASAALGVEPPREIVVNVRNRTDQGGPAVPELPSDAVVETVARVAPDGVRPIAQPPLPSPAGRLLRRVRDVERELLAAALSRDVARASAALREHPAGGPDAARVFPDLSLAER